MKNFSLNNEFRVSAEFIKREYPVGAIVKYSRGNWMVMRFGKNDNPPPPTGRRGKIMSLSRKSLARLTFVANATDVEFTSMITLTYPKEIAQYLDGKMAKKHLKNVLSWLNKFDELEYIWFAEFTKTGSIHFHILTNVFPVTPRMRLDLCNTWIRAIMGVFSGYNPVYDGTRQPPSMEDLSTRLCSDEEKESLRLHLIQTKAAKVILHSKSWLMRKPETSGFAGYVAKYAYKKYQKQVPPSFENIGRFWGNSAGVTPKPKEIYPCSEDYILEKLKDKGVDFELAPKYLWGVEMADVAIDEIPF